LIANVYAGIKWSRLTAITKVRVVGALPEDQQRISDELGAFANIPALQVNPRKVETQLYGRSAVEKVSVSRNVFGRAVVELEYRTPVAQIGGTGGAALSEDGVVFQAIQPLKELPIVELPPEAIVPVLTVAGPWQSGDVGNLAAQVNQIGGTESKTITASENGGLCLNIGSKFAVQLGLPDRLGEKIDYLRRKLDEDPGLLTSGKTLILVSLDRPTFGQGVVKKER